MFEFAVTTAGLSAAVDRTKTVPVVVAPTSDDSFQEDYTRIASKLGVSRTPTQDGFPLKAWLGAAGIACYGEVAVQHYLQRVLGRNSQTYNTLHQSWFWRSVREQDHERPRRFAGAHVGPVIIIHSGATYAKPIPYPVLLTMERVHDQFSNATFYISDHYTSDEKDALRDPFLLVVVDSERYVIERWDEPSFRG
jgi:hypothetical protein